MATTKLLTAEDLFLMGEDDGRFELIKGELHDLPPAGGIRGEIGLGIAARMWLHVHENRLGTVYNSETGFILARNPDLVLAPDVSFVQAERSLPRERQVGFLEVAPDLVVEVVSPSESSGDVANKVSLYLNAGVKLVWVVHPRNRIISVYRADRTWDMLQGNAELDGGDVLARFSLPLTEVFGEES